jgi:hypothetical protein
VQALSGISRQARASSSFTSNSYIFRPAIALLLLLFLNPCHRYSLLQMKRQQAIKLIDPFI